MFKISFLKMMAALLCGSFLGVSLMARESLKQYHAKRNLKKSGEPSSGKPSKGKDKIFVVQEHNASHLHFDFRIEIDGTLVSWAVPKGPSLNPQDKHLAIQTENHPMDYANFEGIIPEGYGAGEVIVWDKGTYTNKRSISMKKSLDEGKIEIILHGKKLKGAFVLIKTKLGWLFFKAKDAYSDARKNIIKSEPQSIKSGKTIEDLAHNVGDSIRSGSSKTKPRSSVRGKKSSKKNSKK